MSKGKTTITGSCTSLLSRAWGGFYGNPQTPPYSEVRSRFVALLCKMSGSQSFGKLCFVSFGSLCGALGWEGLASYPDIQQIGAYEAFGRRNYHFYSETRQENKGGGSMAWPVVL